MAEEKSLPVTLVLGGARSGKSAFAEKLALQRAGKEKVLYVATLQPFDQELEERVAIHRASRPGTWRTLEAPFALSLPVFRDLQDEKLVLIDCLTVWTSNLLIRENGETREDGLPENSLKRNPTAAQLEGQFDEKTLEVKIKAELENLVLEVKARGLGLVLVSNEVGMGLVPPYPLGRYYRDLLGRVNQFVAGMAEEVFIVWAGIPVDLKKLQAHLA